MPILKKWEIANWIWIIAAGSLLHFVYDLTGENPFVGVFVPVNESVWEHLKLLLLPVFLFSLVEYRFFSSYGARFWYAKAVGLLAGMLVIVNLFYFYTGILGRNLFVLDILTFVLGPWQAPFVL